MTQLDLTKFRDIPGHPAYKISEEGAVLTLKKRDLTTLTPQGSTYGGGVWLRVTLDGYTYRLRDLVRLVWGSTQAFTATLPEPDPRDGEDEAWDESDMWEGVAW